MFPCYLYVILAMFEAIYVLYVCATKNLVESIIVAVVSIEASAYVTRIRETNQSCNCAIEIQSIFKSRRKSRLFSDAARKWQKIAI